MDVKCIDVWVRIKSPESYDGSIHIISEEDIRTLSRNYSHSVWSGKGINSLDRGEIVMICIVNLDEGRGRNGQIDVFRKRRNVHAIIHVQ